MLPEPEFEATDAGAPPPHSREAEEAVVGCVLIAPEMYESLSEIVVAQDFYIHRLGFIWQAYQRLHARRAGIDILTVSDELQDMGRLDDIGGQAYLTALLNQVPTTLHAETYAEIVKDFSSKREFLAMALRLAEFSTNGKTAAEIAAYTEKELTRITVTSNVETNAIMSSKEAMQAGLKVTQSAASGETNTVPTGLIDLDKLLRGGPRKGRLILIAGRPGDGKSSLLLTVANNAAVLHKKRVGIFSMEMPTEEQVNRLVSQLSGISFDKIESGKLSDEDWPSYYHFVSVVENLEIYWDDTPSLTVPQLRTKAHKMAEAGLDLIVLDSLNLMNAQMNGAKEFEKINTMGYALKILARELDVPVLAAHHMNRAAEQHGGSPQLSDLEQAGEKPADIVGFIYQDKDDPQQANVRSLKIAKHRGGPTGTVNLIFRGNLTKFENAVVNSFSLTEPPHRKDIDG